MPINLLNLQQKLPDFSAQIKSRMVQVAKRQEEAMGVLKAYADQLDELRTLVSRAADLVPRLRCAVPVREPLDAVIPMPALPKLFTLLAADGSQINPSRHTRVPFCVINVGVIRMMRGSGRAPQVYTHSHLLDVGTLFQPGGGLISEGMVALRRDLRERQVLVDYADDLQLPAISMTDGPLELIREPQESRGFARILDQYLNVLRALHEKGLMTLGYVDKPASDLIGRLLELVYLSDEDLESYNQRQRSFEGVSDINLMQDLLLEPGDRSAVFAIHSQTALRFRDALALHFFYLNVGRGEKPHISRVEIPGWIAQDPESLGLLQAVLTEQASIMGTRSYPYILHRAHEEALVSVFEHKHVEEMIVAEFQRKGIPVGETSHKQQLKDLSTKKMRYSE